MIYAVLLLFILAQIADIVSTYLALKHPDVTESNPIMKKLMGTIGIAPALILSKLAVVGILAIAYAAFPIARIPLAIGVGISIPWYIYVVINNFRNAYR